MAYCSMLLTRRFSARDTPSCPSAAATADLADGVIVGAALVDKIDSACRTGQEVVEAAFRLINEFRQAMDKKGQCNE